MNEDSGLAANATGDAVIGTGSEQPTWKRFLKNPAPKVLKRKKLRDILSIKENADVHHMQLIHGKHVDTLKIHKGGTDKWVEVRGKPNYETHGYDPKDKLHKVLDQIGAPTVSALMAGDKVFLNPNNSRSKSSYDMASKLFGKQ